MSEAKEARDFMRQLVFIAIGVLVGLFVGVASSSLFEILKGNYEKRIFIIFIFSFFTSILLIKRFAWIFVHRKTRESDSILKWIYAEWSESKLDFLLFIVGPFVALIFLFIIK